MRALSPLLLLVAGACTGELAGEDACGVPTERAFEAVLLPAAPDGFRDAPALDRASDPPTLVVSHRQGIDGVRIVRSSGPWPAAIAVRFEGFSGLEGINATAWGPGDARRSATRADLAVVGRSQVVTGPDGAVTVAAEPPFSATLGRPLLAGGACAIHLGWVDWYRR